MTSNTALEVRPFEVSDRDDWTALWTAYLDFYGTSVPSDTFSTYLIAF
jgi:hypothetical protein